MVVVVQSTCWLLAVRLVALRSTEPLVEPEIECVDVGPAITCKFLLIKVARVAVSTRAAIAQNSWTSGEMMIDGKIVVGMGSLDKQSSPSGLLWLGWKKNWVFWNGPWARRIWIRAPQFSSNRIRIVLIQVHITREQKSPAGRDC